MAKRLQRATEQLRRRALAAETANLEDAKRTSIRLSSGRLSTADLRRRDYPYARRHPGALEDPAVLNKQSGRLARAWTTEGPFATLDGLVSHVRNSSPEAQFMGGTRLMWERPLAERVQAEIAPRMAARRRKALRITLR
jgi:hypothetical protein